MANNKEAKETTDSVASETTVTVTSDRGQRFNLKKLPKRMNWRYVILLVVICGVAIFFITGGFNRNTVNIGGNKISKSNVNQLGNRLAAYKKAHPAVSFGSNLQQYASDKLILNAALKLEAKKYNVTISDDDLAKALDQAFPSKQSEQTYFDNLRKAAKDNSPKADPTNEIQLLNLENGAYQTKLQDKLLNKENLTVVTMILDTPYFAGLPQSQTQAAFDQAQARMKNEFLPLVAAGKSVQAISQKADVSYNSPAQSAANDNAAIQKELALYYSQGVVAVSQLNGYQKGATGFNDNNSTNWIRGNYGTIAQTTDKVDQLKKPGDNTGVFTSKSGALMIIRLDSQTGGAYNSWTDFLNYYKQKYATGKLQVAATALSSSVTGIANKLMATITTPGLDQAWAFDCSTPGHTYTLSVVGRDMVSGGTVDGARLTQHRPNSGTFTYTDTAGEVITVTPGNQCATPGDRTITTDASAIYGDGTVVQNGRNTLSDDCFGLPPSFSSAAPSGWQPVDSGPYSDGGVTNAQWQHDPPDTLAWGSYSYREAGYPDPPNADDTNHIRPGIANFNTYWVILEYKPQGKPICLPCHPCDTTCKGHPPGGYTPYVDPQCTYLTVDNNFYNGVGGLLGNKEDTGKYDDTLTEITVTGVSGVSGGTGTTITPSGFTATYDTYSTPNSLNYTWAYTPGTSVSITISKWYWSPGRTPTPGYDAMGGYSPYTATVTCTPPPQLPVGSIDTAQCINGVSGWAQDPDNGGALHVAVSYKQGQTTDSSGATPYGYGALGDGTYIANGARGDAENGHGFTIPIDPGLLDGNRYSFFVTAYGIDTSGNQDSYNAAIGNSSATANTMLACAPFTTTGSSTPTLNPSTEDPATYSTSSNGNVAYTSSVASGFNPGISMGCNVVVTANAINPYGGPQDCAGSFNRSSTAITGPSGSVITPLTAGDVYCSFLNLQYSSGIVQEDGAVYNTLGWGSFGGSCPKVDNKPFFKVLSGDTSAGGAFSSVGNPNCSGGGVLAGWNNNSGTNPDFGASAQIGALAIGPITGFASNQSTFNNSPTGLSFANTVSADISNDPYSPKLGGNFNTAAGAGDCFTDVTAPVSGSVGGPVTLGTTVVSPGVNQNQSYFVNGDVYITGNILYKGDNGVTGPGASWNSQSDVPSMVIHATGDIKISPNVTELDGLYMSTGGKIYTCAPAASGAVPDSFISNSFSTCNNQLTVYGKFIANQVSMGRTSGSLRDETPIPSGSIPGPNIDTSVAFNRYLCSSNGSDPGSHFYQNSATSAPLLPSSCGTPEGNPGGLGYILPAPGGTCDTPGATLLWEADDPTIGTGYFYTTNTVEPHTTIVGCVPPSGPNTTPVYRFFDHVHGGHFWTISNAEYSSLLSDTNLTYEGAAFSVYTAAGDGGKATTISVGVHPPTAPLTCSNPGSATPLSPQTCAAEVFYSTPELYLSTPKIGKPSLGAQQWDAITSLPPLL
ncbi:MAG TPA: SurA N-terminal domain-containing protein [Candidatus Saccharimonadales bacterium]